MIRDSLLAVSGRLNREPGGPGFRPFEVRFFNSHFYDLVDSADPPMRKRTVYRIVVRSGHDPMLEAFDCPDASDKAPRRSHTTTPIQALALMNSPFVLRQADHLADRLRRALPGDSARQIELAYRLALGRGPNPQESGRAVAHAGDQGPGEFLLGAAEFERVSLPELKRESSMDKFNPTATPLLPQEALSMELGRRPGRDCTGLPAPGRGPRQCRPVPLRSSPSSFPGSREADPAHLRRGGRQSRGHLRLQARVGPAGREDHDREGKSRHLLRTARNLDEESVRVPKKGPERALGQ